MFKGTIEKRVLSIINSAIASAEKEYKSICEEIDKKAETEKVTAVETLVNSIFNITK